MPSRQLSSSELWCKRFVCQLMAASIDSLSQVRVLLWNVMGRAGAVGGVVCCVFMGINYLLENETTRVKKFVSF